MTDEYASPLVIWLDAVRGYWDSAGELCQDCEWNDPDRGCDFLYQDRIPWGECPGIQVRQPNDQ